MTENYQQEVEKLEQLTAEAQYPENLDSDEKINEVLEMYKDTNSPIILNRAQRRRLQKQHGKEYQQSVQTITQTAKKMAAIDLIQKLRELREKKENEENETAQDGNSDVQG